MRKLHDEANNDKIREVWVKLDKHILDYVISILRSHAFVDHLDEINSPYALIPIFVYCIRKNTENFTDEEIRKIVKWFFYAQLRSRYASQMPQKLDKDLRTISSSSQQPFDFLLQTLSEENRLAISPSEFIGSDIRHPLFSLMRWYFKSKNAICFETGLDLRSKSGPKYQLERDHIFPFSKLKERGYGKNNRTKYALAQELTNRVILKRPRSGLEGLAENYLLTVRKNFPKALALQCIPEKEELWKLEHYEQFLEDRRSLLTKELNNFLENITTSGESENPITIEELIAEGESHELEFKSSLRWDRKENTLNKKLEDVVIKAVAAFANSQGGTLLIGVNDDGSISGLEADYQSLKGANRDKFELHLRNLFNDRLGKQFTAFKITISFHKIEDSDICQIDIAPAKEPVIIIVSNKSGQVEEKLYVRSGNSSQELPLNEIGAYIKERFT